MQKSIRQEAALLLKQDRHRRSWKRAVRMMACVVALCTVYALILPAVTMEKESSCDVQEHTPNEYEASAAKTECPADWEAMFSGLRNPPTDPSDPIATDPANPPTQATDPSEPTMTESAEEPSQATDPSEPEMTEPAETPTQATDPSEPAMTEPAEVSTQATDPSEPAMTDPTERPTQPPEAEAPGTAPENPEAVADLVEPQMRFFAARNTQDTAGSVDLTPMIRTVSLQHRGSEEDPWTDVTEHTVVRTTDQIQCTIIYLVPGNTLSEQCTTLTYQVPAGMRLRKAEHGEVYNSTGNRVGTYSIDETGLIRIQFDPEYVQKNGTEGLSIDGSIRFEGSIDTSEANESGEVVILFRDDLQIHVKVDEQAAEAGDIQASKQARRNPDGTITFTVTLTSTDGTFGEVHLTDTMTGASYAGGLQITDQAGQPVAVSAAPAAGAKSFSLTLPQMPANGRYVMTYDAKPDEDLTASHVRNAACAESVNNRGAQIEGRAEVTVPVRMLEKTGEFLPDTNEVAWTVTVNPDRMDLSGWILRDFLQSSSGESEFYGPVTLTDSQGHTQELVLPYTFPEGSSDVYTIRYRTPAPQLNLGSNFATNRVVLEKDAQTPFQDTETVGVGSFQPAEKQSGTVRVENGKAVIPWTVTLDFTQQGLTAAENGSFGVSDLLNQSQSNQYLTRTQLENVRTQISSAFEQAGIRVGNWEASRYQGDGTYEPWPAADADGTYDSFRFRILDSIPQGTRIEFTYEATGDLGDGTHPVTYTNRFGIERVWATDEAVYHPEQITVRKKDPEHPDQTQSEHVLQELENRELVWTIEVFLPESLRHGPVTVTDQLPQNLTLTGLTITSGTGLNRNSSTFPAWTGNTSTVTCASKRDPMDGNTFERFEVTATRTADNQIVIELPQRLTELAEGTYEFEVRAQFEEAELIWTEDGTTHRSVFSNQVTVTDGSQSAQAEQTQVVTKDDYYDAVSKTGTVIRDRNVISYTVRINPHGLDLLPGSDTLTLVDVMKFDPQSGQLRAGLVPGSVKVQQLLPDGMAGEPVEAPYTYEFEENPQTGEKEHLLCFTVPDSRPLLVTYEYQFRGTEGLNIPVTNTATLHGIQSDEVFSLEKVEIQIQSSSATADLRGIVIFKVDAGDNGVFLPGAVFELSRWNGTAYEPVQTLTSDADGRVYLTADTIGTLAYNTAYRLTETQAPEGYFRTAEPYEFYVVHPDETVHPLTLPQDFQGERRQEGEQHYFRNERNTTSIHVEKSWQNEQGQPLVHPELQEITVTLYRQTSDTDRTVHGTYILKAAENWELHLDDLPAAVQNEDGTRGADYRYTVAEVPVPGFRVTYHTEEGIHEGTIRLTNRKESGYVLPETGGMGQAPILLAGLGCMGSSLVLLIRKKRR